MNDEERTAFFNFWYNFVTKSDVNRQFHAISLCCVVAAPMKAVGIAAVFLRRPRVFTTTCSVVNISLT